MKKFKFFIGQYDGKFISASSGGHYKNLPKEFTIDDIQKQEFISASIKERCLKIRPGNYVKVSRLCGWSSRSGCAEYLFIKCIDEEEVDALKKLRNEISKMQTRIKEIDELIYKVFKSEVDESKLLEKTIKQTKNKLYELENSQ